VRQRQDHPGVGRRVPRPGWNVIKPLAAMARAAGTRQGRHLQRRS
jgi:hypothetical protein